MVSQPYKQARLDALLNALAAGMTRTCAAAAAGIDRSTLYDWIHADPAIADAITRAELSFAGRVEQQFGDDALSSDDWRARESWLKRRRRREWGDEINLRAIPTETLLELLDGGSDDEDDGPISVQALRRQAQLAAYESGEPAPLETPPPPGSVNGTPPGPHAHPSPARATGGEGRQDGAAGLRAGLEADREANPE